jgi:hypothetical protein
MPVDHTPRYETTGDDGLQLRIYADDDIISMAGEYPPAPDGVARLSMEPRPVTHPEETHLVPGLTWREVRDTTGEPGLTRLDTDNEAGGTHLGPPLWLRWQGLTGHSYRLEVPGTQSLWAPFDLRRGLDAYEVLDSDGEPIPGPEARHWLNLQGGRYRLYLVPRRWRYVAWLIVHYAWIIWHNVVSWDLPWTSAHWSRPPVYPYRHDVLHTAGNPQLPGYYALLDYDQGIDWAWCHSRRALRMAREIIQAQYFDPYTWSAFVYMGAETPEITPWAWEPWPGDLVLGIERLCDLSGASSMVWVRQTADLAGEYPRWPISTFLSSSWVPPPIGAPLPGM